MRKYTLEELDRDHRIRGSNVACKICGALSLTELFCAGQVITGGWDNHNCGDFVLCFECFNGEGLIALALMQ